MPSSSNDAPPQVAIHAVGAEGDGIGRLPDGRTVFVGGALPGDVVQLEQLRQRKGVARAEVESIRSPSPDRVASECTVAQCGGCRFRELDIAAQRQVKVKRLIDAVTRIGKIEVVPENVPMRAGQPWAYRHRARLHASWRDGWQLGYHARGSHDLVPFDTCPVLWGELQEVAVAVAECVARWPRDARLREVEVIFSRVDGRAALHVRCDGPVLTDDCDELLRIEAVVGVQFAGDGSNNDRGDSRLRYDSEFPLAMEPSAFTQANPEINAIVVASVRESLQGVATIVEAHAGIGNFSLPLALGGAELTTLEANERAVELARYNAKQAGVQIAAKQISDVEVAGGRLGDMSRFDALLLDPPRTGARDLARAIADRGPARVAYVSCDPATLARDLAILCAGGYVLRELTAFDMFPQTPHVEALAVLQRA